MTSSLRNCADNMASFIEKYGIQVELPTVYVVDVKFYPNDPTQALRVAKCMLPRCQKANQSGFLKIETVLTVNTECHEQGICVREPIEAVYEDSMGDGVIVQLLDFRDDLILVEPRRVRLHCLSREAREKLLAANVHSWNTSASELADLQAMLNAKSVDVQLKLAVKSRESFTYDAQLFFSPDGKYLSVLCRDKFELRVYDVEAASLREVL